MTANPTPPSALSHHADCDASACVYECPVAAEVDGLMALSGAIRTLRERGWTVEPPAGTWRGNAPSRAEKLDAITRQNLDEDYL